MSFSSDVKGELARHETKKKCCMLAEIAGFLAVSSSVTLAGGGRLGIAAVTESAATARHVKKLLNTYFKCNPELAVGDSHIPGASGRKGHNRYYLNISPEEKSMYILRETGRLLIREGEDYFSDGIYGPITKSKCCRKAYLRGLFLGCGTMSDPHKSYHLEFVLDKEQTANDLRKLIGTFTDLSANLTKRGSSYVVYVKKAAYVSDLLGIMGADDAVLELENIRVSKNVHGNIKRMMNFDNANVDKILRTAEEQRSWISTIISAELGRPVALDDPDAELGLRHLPQPLREVAVLRIERPYASLTEIGEALTPQIGKPAVNKRFARLKAIAEKIEQTGKMPGA